MHALSRFDYRTWQQGRLTVGGKSLLFATKPGVTKHGEHDIVAEMLASAVCARMTGAGYNDTRALTVVSLACGNGCVGAAAALVGSTRRGATHVVMTDRYLPDVHAAMRTTEANRPAHSTDAHRVEIVHAHGVAHLADHCADIVSVRVVPERIPMLLLLREAQRTLKHGGVCLLAGGNHEGAKSAARVAERLFGAVKLEAQHSAHRLVSALASDSMPAIDADVDSAFVDTETFHEMIANLDGIPTTLFTRPGVFSWEHVDEATTQLLACVSIRPGERVLDLGCGAGALGVAAARRSGRGDVALVDADADAVRCAQRTIDAANVTNARVLASDVALAVLDERFDVVLANPPFHLGRETNLELPQQFMRDAHKVLKAGGRLCVVANRTLPYESILSALFGNVSTVYDGPRFKVLQSEKRATT